MTTTPLWALTEAVLAARAEHLALCKRAGAAQEAHATANAERDTAWHRWQAAREALSAALEDEARRRETDGMVEP